MIEYVFAETGKPLAQARILFTEYAASLSFELCFQHFDQELAALPGDYAPPSGCLIVAQWQGQPAGCVALRQLQPEICEMKRMFVRSQYRGKGIGRGLAEAVIHQAQEIGYTKMRLDTHPSMVAAVALYRTLGFRTIQPYYDNPIPGALYFELDLNQMGKLQ